MIERVVRHLTKDELKQKLKSAWLLHKQIEEHLAELQELRSFACKITPVYSLVPGGSSCGQKLENNIAKIADMEVLLQDETDEFLKSLREVRELIKLINDPMQRLIMQKRYLNYQKWEVIAADLGYSWRRVHQLHGEGLKEILKKLIFM